MITSLISTGKVGHHPDSPEDDVELVLLPGERGQLLSRGGRLGALVGGAHQLPGFSQLSGGFDHDQPPPQIYQLSIVLYMNKLSDLPLSTFKLSDLPRII